MLCDGGLQQGDGKGIKGRLRLGKRKSCRCCDPGAGWAPLLQALETGGGDALAVQSSPALASEVGNK